MNRHLSKYTTNSNYLPYVPPIPTICLCIRLDCFSEQFIESQRYKSFHHYDRHRLYQIVAVYFMGQQPYHGKILDGVDYPWDLFIWSQWKWGHSNCWNSLQAIFVWVIAVKWMHWKVATLHFLRTMELNHMQMNSLFLKELKLSVSQKKIEESKHLLKDFSDCWDPLLNDLEEFKKKMNLHSSTGMYSLQWLPFWKILSSLKKKVIWSWICMVFKKLCPCSQPLIERTTFDGASSSLRICKIWCKLPKMCISSFFLESFK